MEAISFNRIGDKSAFIEAARKIGFDQFAIAEVDVAAQVGQDLLGILIYGWTVYHQHLRRVHEEAKKCGPTEFAILKVLTQSTLDLWFSREWRTLDAEQRYGVVYSLLKTSYMHRSLQEYNAIDWGYLERMPNDPWSSPYWQRALERSCIEDGSAPRPDKSDPILLLPEEELQEDEDEFRQEGIYLIALRLVKMFDGGWLPQVCDLSMRAMIVFYRMFDEVTEMHRGVPEYYLSSWKSCFVLIAHIQLIALFHMDQTNLSQLNLVLDAMTRQFLVFRRGGATAPVKSASSYIAYLAHRLGLDMKTFTSGYVRYNFRNSYRSPFGEASQVYKAYSLSYHVIYMNREMQADRDVDTEAYRELFSQYVEERVKADQCVRNEMTRLKRRRRRKEDPPALKSLTAYMEKLGSGVALGGRDGVVREPVFNSLPKREDTLRHALKAVQRHSAVAWDARIIVLVKIISQSYNAVEMWRYHAGLSTDFMMQLEQQLAEYFGELAGACKAHPFLEQELWLTAFYLHPIETFYKAVVRCGVRNMRRAAGADKAAEKERIPKYGLYSSSVVVDDIVEMTEYGELQSDYDLLDEVLTRLQLPGDYVKDLLTVTFQTRSKLFMWSYPWKVLRNRCKTLLSKPERKRVYIEQNMSEANDRLKYLQVDYEKYKDRPQLDYGTIELGYEDALLNEEDGDEEPAEVADEQKAKAAAKKATKRVSSRYCFIEDDEEEEDDDEDMDSGSEADISMKPSRTRNSSKADMDVDDISQEAFVNTVRTRARTAAIRQETTRAKAVTTPKSGAASEAENEEKEQKASTTGGEQAAGPQSAGVPVSQDYKNTTEGFGLFTNIWDEPVDPAVPLDHTPLTAVVVRKMLNQYLSLMQTMSQRRHDRPAEHSSQDEQATTSDSDESSMTSSSSEKKRKRSRHSEEDSHKPPTVTGNEDPGNRIPSDEPENQVVSVGAEDPGNHVAIAGTPAPVNQIASTGTSDPCNQVTSSPDPGSQVEPAGPQDLGNELTSAKTPDPGDQETSEKTPGPGDQVASTGTPDPDNETVSAESQHQDKQESCKEKDNQGPLVTAVTAPKVAKGREKLEQQLDLEPMTSRRALELQKKLGISLQLAAISRRAQKHSAGAHMHVGGKRPRRLSRDRTKEAGGKEPGSISNKSASGRNESESGHNKPESGRNESESGHNKPETGRNESESGHNKPESGHNKPESGRNVPESATTDLKIPIPSCQALGVIHELNAPQDEHKDRTECITPDTLVGESSERLSTPNTVARGEHRNDETPVRAPEQVEQQPIPEVQREPDPQSEPHKLLKPEQNPESMPGKPLSSDKDLKLTPEIDPEQDPESELDWNPDSDTELYTDSEKNEYQTPNNHIEPNYSQEDLRRMLAGTQCVVRLKYLTVEDFKDLRQPRVILKRLSLERLTYNHISEADSTDRSSNTTPQGSTPPRPTSTTDSATDAKVYVPSPRRTRPKRPRSYAHLYSSSDSSEETTLTGLRRRYHCPKSKSSKRHKPQPAAPTATATATGIVRPVVMAAAKSLTVTSSSMNGGGFKLRISSSAAATAKDICVERKQPATTFRCSPMQQTSADANEVMLSASPSQLFPVAGRIWKSAAVSRATATSVGMTGNVYTNLGPFIEAPAPDPVSDPLSMEDESIT